MRLKTRLLAYVPAIGVFALPAIAAAAGGTPIDDAATNALEIAQGLGVAVGTAGLCGMGGGLAFGWGGVIRGGAACTAGGGLVAGAGAIADTVLGGIGAAGLAVADLVGPAPTNVLAHTAGLFF